MQVHAESTHEQAQGGSDHGGDWQDRGEQDPNERGDAQYRRPDLQWEIVDYLKELPFKKPTCDLE